VPLALTLLGPIIVNILLYHASMEPSGLALAVFVVLLWGVTFARVRSAFAGMLAARVETTSAPTIQRSRVVSPA
jgi:hypothetical protein